MEFRDLLDEATALPGGLYICGNMYCPSFVKGHPDGKIEQIIEDYDLIQHIHEPTHNRGRLLDLVITSPSNPDVKSMHVEDIGLSDHFLVLTTLSSSRPHPVCESFEVKNVTSIDMEMFRLMLMKSEIATTPKSETNNFAAQLKDCTIGVLNKLAPV